jgi:uncharacterized repeat protein (TIGR01451 family)
MSSIVWATIFGPIIALVMGFALDRMFRERPRLIAYISAIFTIKLPNPPPGVSLPGGTVVNTHTLIVSNNGRKPAHNVLISHMVPQPTNFQVFPLTVQYDQIELRSGGTAIKIPVLVQHEQVTVNYLYYAPMTVSNVMTDIKCDEGSASFVKVLLRQQTPVWLNWTTGLCALVGLSTIVYWIIRFVTVMAELRH